MTSGLLHFTYIVRIEGPISIDLPKAYSELWGCLSAVGNLIQLLEYRLEFILAPEVVVVVPSGYFLGVNVDFKVGDNAEVVTGTSHGPV
jgi:hypothetical protein